MKKIKESIKGQNNNPNKPHEKSARMVIYAECKNAVCPNENEYSDDDIQNKHVDTITEEFLDLSGGYSQIITMLQFR